MLLPLTFSPSFSTKMSHLKRFAVFTKSAACCGASSGSSRIVKLPLAVSTTASVPGATAGSAGAGFAVAGLAGACANEKEASRNEAAAGATYDSILIGGRAVPTVGIDGLRGHVFPTLLEGRAPRAADEIVQAYRATKPNG